MSHISNYVFFDYCTINGQLRSYRLNSVQNCEVKKIDGFSSTFGRLLLHKRPDITQIHFLYGQCSVVWQVPATVDGVT